MLAAELARLFECDTIIDIGSGDLRKLLPLHPEFRLIAIDHPQMAAKHYDADLPVQVIGWDFSHAGLPPIRETRLQKALLICADMIEHLVEPAHLLNLLGYWLETAPCAVLSTPDRDRVRGLHDFGPPANVSHVREWNRSEFSQLLRAAGLREWFSGYTFSSSDSDSKATILSVIVNHALPVFTPAPPDFRVVATMNVYNKADIIATTLSHLIEQGIETAVIDNWSTDGTYEIAQQFQGKGLIHLERFPAHGRGEYADQRLMCTRHEELTRELPGTWFVHHDADERLESPWAGINLCDALYFVDRCGFNCVNFSALNFRPIDEHFVPGSDYTAYFRHFEFGRRQWYGWLTRAWKNLGQPSLGLADYSGHLVTFEGRRIFPFRFLLRHYPIRSSRHGEQKLIRERRHRKEELEAGFSVHYSTYQPGQSLLHDPGRLLEFNPAFHAEFLVERLIYQGRIIERFRESMGF